MNSHATHRIINQFKHYSNAKILLIDIIGNVFSYESELYRSFNATDYDSLRVLTILTDKFKEILDSKYHLEFSRYLSLKNLHTKSLHDAANIVKFLCDQRKINGSSNYHNFSNDFALCQLEVKKHCYNYTNDDIKSLCMNASTNSDVARHKENEDKMHLNEQTFNKQLVFSEHFNLFDFITSMAQDEKNASNQKRYHHQFDFIIVDFKSILNVLNESTVIWRPFMILEQNEINGNLFIMHHALSEHDEFKNWVTTTTNNLWMCGTFCWIILAAVLLTVMLILLIISVSAGIAGR